MIDVSHISDDAFWQVMELSKTPVIASHSSCRHFVPDFERNIDDKMIKRLAEGGGVVMINFGSYFLTKEANASGKAAWEARKAFMKEHKLDYNDPKVEAFGAKYRQQHPPTVVDVEVVADHIDHVVKLVGEDHVGLGSDFDGVRDLPTGLESAAELPNLIAALIQRGYSDATIEKICSGNVLRVWSQVEQYAKRKPRKSSSY